MYRSLSLWHDTADEVFAPRPALGGTVEADVAIVGAGYTGLWTAYYLKKAQPDLRIVVVEAEIAGYGASGRNGGWCAGEIAGNRDRMARQHGREPVRRLLQAMFDTVDEVEAVTKGENIACDFQKGGILTFATNTAHFVRLHNELEHLRAWGFGEDDYRWLEPKEVDERARVAGSRGALFTPHAAAVHPAKLARGLATAVERLGVVIYEQSRVEVVGPGGVATSAGQVEAEVILRCTEAFTTSMPGERRTYLPVYSLMVATEPLGDWFWDEAGFRRREVFNDPRYVVMYGQRTADDRIAFGARGARYHFGSHVDPVYDHQPIIHEAIVRLLRTLFPKLADVEITHRWGGAVAIPRDWRPAVVFDRSSGFGYAGGYVGEGVAASNLAGRTLTDLVLGRKTDLVDLPWAQHRVRKWEPEPLRFIGVNAATWLAPSADQIEARTGQPSRVMAGLLHALTGK